MNRSIAMQFKETSNDTITVSSQTDNTNSVLLESPNVESESLTDEDKAKEDATQKSAQIQKELTIQKGQYISDILSEIPTNTIIDKTITNCGMTTMELKSKRHSMIIVPNKPIVTGKMKKHKDVFGVIEGVSTENIIKYLEIDTTVYKKFITTPESFFKIIAAFKSKGINYFKDYFILLDECERAIKDVNYRKDIINPFDIFFDFDGKALVSATPLPFSDPRFKSFTHLKIKPDYDYRVNVHLRVTNNPKGVLFDYLNRNKKEEAPIFIFFNSVTGTRNYIATFGIEKESNIYCSSESKKELLKNEQCKNLNIYEDIDESKCFNKYNFMTSKFYSGMDVDLEFCPNVIFITDYCIGKHSLADPYSDIYQAHGRFRNGVKNFIHITGYNKGLDVMSIDKLKLQIKEQRYAYKDIKNLVMNSNRPYYNHSINEVVTYHVFHPYMRHDRLNYFMIDWRLFINYRDSCYLSCRSIRIAYSNSEKFTVNYKYLGRPFSSKDEMTILDNLADEITRNKKIIEVIDAINKSEDKSEYSDKFLEVFKDLGQFLIEASSILSQEELAATNYKTVMIKECMEKKKAINVCKDDIHNTFKKGEYYSTADVNKHLTNIFEKHNISTNKRGMTDILKNYFEIAETRKSSERGVTIIEKI